MLHVEHLRPEPRADDLRREREAAAERGRRIRRLALVTGDQLRQLLGATLRVVLDLGDLREERRAERNRRVADELVERFLVAAARSTYDTKKSLPPRRAPERYP